MKKLLIIVLLIHTFALRAQEELLNAGPMVGYSTMQEVSLWVQTNEEAKVRIAYRDQQNPDLVRWTNEAIALKENGFTAKLIADTVEPGRKYNYQVYINDIYVKRPYETSFQTQPIWKWRGDPPEFSFVTGSCAYINEPEYDRPGKGYGSDYHIFKSIAAKDPDFMIWLGDNVYLREPDWNSTTGIFHRYTHDRATAELQPLLGSVHHYAIWDDHDYGPNNSDRSWWNKASTLKAFKYFWPNPSYGLPGVQGIFTSFQWGDVDFILLDDRWYRAPGKLQAEGKSLLGEQQLQWLLDALVSSEANFKVVALGSQFLNNSDHGETYYNDGFREERNKIIDFIHEQNIKNVIFITGDKHYSELSKLEKEGKPVIYDLTSSSLTAGSNTHGDEENNTLRVKGTAYTDHNFALINLTGSKENRKFQISLYDDEGNAVWNYEIEKQ